MTILYLILSLYIVHLTGAMKMNANFLTDYLPLGAKCLDGSPANYYFKEGYGDGVDKWVVFYEGGGLCRSHKDCFKRSMTALGSTKDDKSVLQYGSNAVNDDPKKNPMMYNWNFAVVRYCDGGLYLGGNFSRTVYNGVDLFFRGRLIVESVMDHLLHVKGMSKATDIVITGCSAGGVSVYLNSNYHYDIIKSVNPSVRISNLPDSGWFPFYDTPPSKFYAGVRSNFEMQNASYGIDEYCKRAHPPSFWTNCVFPENVIPFLKTPTFILQSRFDTWQISNELGTSNINAVNAYGSAFTKLIFDTLNPLPKHGIMLDSCAHHCGNQWNVLNIDGHTQQSAFFEWYTTSTPSMHLFQNELFKCEECCNA